MKKFILFILCVAILVGGVMFALRACDSENPTGENVPPNNEVVQPNTEKDPMAELNNRDNDGDEVTYSENEVYIGTGIYNGKVDTSFIEVILEAEGPMLQICKLSPELADKFSSYGFAVGSILSFKYKMVNEQFVITEIIQ